MDKKTKKEVIETLNQEIDWCKNNENLSKRSENGYIEGFLRGLEQAKIIIKQLK